MLKGFLSGFPHSEISGSQDICSSPKLFAAYHVFHRLLVPRHPPCALSSLTFSSPLRVLWEEALVHSVALLWPFGLSFRTSLFRFLVVSAVFTAVLGCLEYLYILHIVFNMWFSRYVNKLTIFKQTFPPFRGFFHLNGLKWAFPLFRESSLLNGLK